MRISPRARNGKRRLGEQNRQFLFQFRRLNTFAAAFADRGRFKEKKRNVRPDGRSELRQFVDREFRFEKFVKRPQGRGRVAAAATESGAMGNCFVKLDSDSPADF